MKARLRLGTLQPEYGHRLSGLAFITRHLTLLSILLKRSRSRMEEAFQPPAGFAAAADWGRGLPIGTLSQKDGKEIWLVQLPLNVRLSSPFAPR